MKSKLINFFISDTLLAAVDEAAKANFCSRSEYIRTALLLRLQGERVIQQQKDDYLESLKRFERRD